MRASLLRKSGLLAVVVAMVATLAVSAGAKPDPNPFVGSWSAVDADGSNISISIGGNGRFQARDDYATICGGVPWSFDGRGTFDFSGEEPVFEASGEMYCFYGSDGGKTFLADTTWPFVYHRNDTIEFDLDGTTYSRRGSKTVGEQFDVLYIGPPESFPAGEAFHINHGWCLDPSEDAKPVGGWTFDLAIDEVAQKGTVDVSSQNYSCLSNDDPKPMNRRTIYSYPNGFAVGTYEFQGFWDRPDDEVFTPGVYEVCFYEFDEEECEA